LISNYLLIMTPSVYLETYLDKKKIPINRPHQINQHVARIGFCWGLAPRPPGSASRIMGMCSHESN
jgi:hypothetical protein